MTKTTYRILAFHPKYAPKGEEVDTTQSHSNALYLKAEYQMAYGTEWQVLVDDDEKDADDY